MTVCTANNCDFLQVAVLGRLFTHRGGAKANSAFHPPELVNEDQLRLGRQRHLRFIQLVNKCVGGRYNCEIPRQCVPYLSSSVAMFLHEEAYFTLFIIYTSHTTYNRQPNYTVVGPAAIHFMAKMAHTQIKMLFMSVCSVAFLKTARNTDKSTLNADTRCHAIFPL